jgi:hypothetical protein
MKCPKCGYVSFDYNLSCPKCGKDISSEQGKLNLPAFKPNPPSLLGTLTGEGGESSVELSVSDSPDVSFARESVQSFDDSSIIDTGGGSLGSSNELDLSLEAADEGKPIKDTGEFELDIGEKSLSDLDEDESASGELSLESDSLTLEQGTVEQEAALGAGAKAAPEAEKEEEEIDLGSLELTGTGGAEEKGEIELKLDDLKINDTGSLEVGEKASATTEIDKPIDIDEITLDEIPLTEELPPEDASKEGEKKGKAEGAPELSADEGEAIDLDDLNLDLDVEEEPKQA